MKFVFALAICICSTESLRVLQNASYKINRGYFKVLFTPYFALLVVVQVTAILSGIGWITCIAVTAVGVYYTFAKRKTRLVFTKRIWRLLAVEYVVVLATTFAVDVNYLAAVAPFAVVVSLFICTPVDGAISNYYLYTAINKLESSSITVIAVVGSYGKTSVKDMLTALLNDAQSPNGSCNTPLGIAKYINTHDLTSKYLVLEFGARQMGDIRQLCEYFRPKYAVVTGVCAQHLSHFKTFNNVLKAKREVVDYLASDGICVLNAQDVYAVGYARYGRCTKVLSDCKLTVSLQQVTLQGTTANVNYNGNDFGNVLLPQISDYASNNFAMCLQMCIQLGQSVPTTLLNVHKITQTPHRLQLSYNGKFYILDDSYNGSIKGVHGCYLTLQNFTCPKVAIMQGIVECGKQREQQNVLCGKYIGDCCDVAIVVGQNSKYLLQGLSCTSCKYLTAKNVTQAVSLATQYVGNGILLFQNDLPDVVNI